MLAINSCTESDDTPNEPSVEGPNYLVMIYGVGGGNLDNGILSNIMQAIDEGGDENVKITFQYKLSRNLQEDDRYGNFDGTRRFTYDDNARFKGTFKEMSSIYPLLDAFSKQYYIDNLMSERIGDYTYDMSCEEGLADFIKWSKSKYPDTKRTLLIIADHGGGWDIVQDGKGSTRAILFDDNLDYKSLTAADVTNGILDAGGVDVLYTDACLMNMYENIYTYAKAAKYLLSSMEIAPDEGGNYIKLISLLKSANADDAGLENAFCQFVDYCASDEWWGGHKDYYLDLGFYNLTKLNSITTVLKKVTDTLTEKFTNNESIQPSTSELPTYGDTFAPYIRLAATECAMANEHYLYTLDMIPSHLSPYMIADGLFDNTEDIDGKKISVCNGSDLVHWLRYAPTEGATEAFERYPKEREDLQYYVTVCMACSYSVTDMLRILDNRLTEVGAKNNPFKQLRTELLRAIKSVSHIACTTPYPCEGIDEPYELCSPGVVMFPMNSDLYDNSYNRAAYYISDYKEALGYYQATEFDKEVGWSNFLKVIDVQSSPFMNKPRMEIERNFSK